MNFVHQPTLETELDAEVKRRNNIKVFFEHDFLSAQQTDDQVSVTVKDLVSEEIHQFSCKYLIGIDGANSVVHEQLGITRTDLGFEADWLVVDYILNDGLTANDLGLVDCGQYCNPERPTTIVPGGYAKGKEYRRWEFMRLPHETKEEMIQVEKVHNLLGEWIKPEQGQLVRHALYTFRSLITDEWRRGRILLAGDAAHLMPPFMGQGMCSGLRDVWNLSWKLDRVLKGEANDDLLDTYEQERKPHITEKVNPVTPFLVNSPGNENRLNKGALPAKSTLPPARPRRLGHVLIFTPNVDSSLQFLQDILGMRLSDRSGEGIAFIHCPGGSEHHVIALAKSAGIGFHHASFLVGTPDEVGIGGDKMYQKGYTKAWGFGCHAIGSNFFHYIADPWNSYVEYYCDMDYIQDSDIWQSQD